MNKRILSLALLFSVMLFAEDRHSFTGIITDSMCADGDHSGMKMGPTDAECTRACIDSHDASYVLYDGSKAYVLSDQKTPEKFAGQHVVITGTLDASGASIHVESIALTSTGK